MIKIQLPRVPFLFMTPKGQMEVGVLPTFYTEGDTVIQLEASVAKISHVNPEERAKMKPLQIGPIYPSAHEAVDALRASVDIYPETYHEADDRHQALRALSQAAGVKVVG